MSLLCKLGIHKWTILPSTADWVSFDKWLNMSLVHYWAFCSRGCGVDDKKVERWE